MADQKQENTPSPQKQAGDTPNSKPAYVPRSRYIVVPAAPSSTTNTKAEAALDAAHPAPPKDKGPQKSNGTRTTAPEAKENPLEKAQKDFEKAREIFEQEQKKSAYQVHVAKVGVAGSERQIELDKKELEQPLWRRAAGLFILPFQVYDLATAGTNLQIAKGIESEKKLLGAKRDRLGELESSYAQSEKIKKQFDEAGALTSKLIAEGKTAEAQALLEKSAAELTKAGKLIGSKKNLVNTKEHTEELERISAKLDDQVRYIGYAETGVRTGRNAGIAVCVAVGTAGIGTGAMAVGGGITVTGWGAGIALTSTGATVAGGLGNLTEATGDSLLGNKETSTAFKDAGIATLRDGKDNLINSASTAAGFVSGKLFTGVLTRGLAVAGTRSVVNSGSRALIDVTVAEKFEWPEVAQQLTGKVTDLEFEEIHSNWQKQRGITVQQLVRNGLIDFGTSTILGSAGAQTSALTQAMSTGTRVATVATVDSTLGILVGTTSGMAKAKLDGREFTGEDFVREVTGSITASSVGTLSQVMPASPQRPPNRTGSGNEPTDANGNPLISRGSILSASPMKALRLTRERNIQKQNLQYQFEFDVDTRTSPPPGKWANKVAVPVIPIAPPAKTAELGNSETTPSPKPITEIPLPTKLPPVELKRETVTPVDGGEPRTIQVDKTGQQHLDFSAKQESAPVAKPSTAAKVEPAATKVDAGEPQADPNTAKATDSDKHQAAILPKAPTPTGTTDPAVPTVHEPIRTKVGRFFDNIRIRAINTMSEEAHQRPLRGPGNTEIEPETLTDLYKGTKEALTDLREVTYRLLPSNRNSLSTKRPGLPMDRGPDGQPVPIDASKVIWVGDKVHDWVNTGVSAVRSVPVLGFVTSIPVRWAGNMITGLVPRNLKQIPNSAWPNGRPNSDWLKDRNNWDQDQTHAPGYSSRFLPENDPWWSHPEAGVRGAPARATAPSAKITTAGQEPTQIGASTPTAAAVSTSAGAPRTQAATQTTTSPSPNSFHLSLLNEMGIPGAHQIGRTTKNNAHEVDQGRYYGVVSFGSGAKRSHQGFGFLPPKDQASANPAQSNIPATIADATLRAMAANPGVEVNLRFASGENLVHSAAVQPTTATKIDPPHFVESAKNALFSAQPDRTAFSESIDASSINPNRGYVVVTLNGPAYLNAKPAKVIAEVQGDPSGVVKAAAEVAHANPDLVVDLNILSGTSLKTQLSSEKKTRR